MKALRLFVAISLCLYLAPVGGFAQEAKKKGKGAMPYPGTFEGAEKHIYKTVGDVELPLYLYKPKGWKKKDRRAAIVFYFGGGWKAGSPTQFLEHCKYLASRGMVAVTVEYRVESRHGVKVEDCVEDAKSAMRWVRSHAGEFGIDPDRIASGGGSAGGHLGAVVGLIEGFDADGEDESVSAMSNAMVLFNPVMAMAPREELPEAYNEKMGGLGDRIRGEAVAISPVEHISKNQPPMIMFFGTADGLKVGADLFLEEYRAAGNRCEMKTYEDMPHGFFNFGRYEGEYYHKTVQEMDRFLVSIGYLKGRKNANVVPGGVEVRKDLVYARRGEKEMLLDLYLPGDASGPVPVVLWVHGGGWKNGSKEKCRAAWLAGEGFAVASINYRLTDEAQWPAQIDDCREAVRWVRRHAEEYGLDGERIGVWGSSAGGHLVALMGTRDYPEDEAVSSRVQAVCDWFGPSDLLTMPPNNVGEGRTEEDVANSNGAKLLGATVREVPKLARQASAFYQVTEDDAPFLIMHGDADPGVPLAQSVKLHERLVEAGVPSQLEIIEGAGHGGAGFATDAVRETVRNFFVETLR